MAHRADYQRVLYEVAISAGVHVYFNSMVTNIEVDLPALHVAGNEVKADLVIGADGKHRVLASWFKKHRCV